MFFWPEGGMKTLRLTTLSFLWFLALTIGVYAFICFWNFTAEDAFIVCRYAENLGDFGTIHFNRGEPVQAFTSPLHVILESLLYLASGSSLIPWKILSLAAWILCVLITVAACGRQPIPSLAVVTLLALPPSAVLWTVGGLETAMLALWVTSMTAIVCRERFDFPQILAVLILAAASFLTRYDSVIFTIPLAACAMLRNGNPKQIAAASLCAATAPLAWLAFAWNEFGDILPTSFYAKPPTLHLPTIGKNLIYVVQWLIFCGLVPLSLLPVLWQGLRRNRVCRQLPQPSSFRWLWMALGLVFAYSLTIATTHMMFCFRCFVPYLPSAAMLAAWQYRNVADNIESTKRQTRWEWTAMSCLFLMILFNAAHLWHTWRHSLEGFTLVVGEYRSIGARDYSLRFLRILREQAEEIRRDWATRRASAFREPRIFTFAAGVLPHAYRSAYIYEVLISYRHHYPYSVKWAADYIHLMSPRHGPVEKQLVKPLSEYKLVSEHEMIFDGSLEKLMVFYDPNPDPHTLPRRVSDPAPSIKNSTGLWR